MDVESSLGKVEGQIAEDLAGGRVIGMKEAIDEYQALHGPADGNPGCRTLRGGRSMAHKIVSDARKLSSSGHGPALGRNRSLRLAGGQVGATGADAADMARCLC